LTKIILAMPIKASKDPYMSVPALFGQRRRKREKTGY